MQIERFKSQSGISVIEIMIVLVITAILVTLSVAQLGSSKTSLTRQNYAREFKVSLERARFDSVKRRAENFDNLSRVTIENSTSFSVWTDLNQNGILDTSEKKLVSLNAQSGINIVGNNLIFPISIRFNRRGQVIVVDGTSTEIPANFIICSDNCTYATANAANSNIIFVSATGTVAMSEGGSSQPNFQNPSVTNTNSCSGVNPWVSIPDENTNTSSCANTNTNTNTNINTNTNTSPSPTPRYCTSGEKPSATGCYCKMPMTVRPSGKCI